MRIVCLGEFVRPGQVGGMEEYFLTLLRGLAGQDCELEVFLRRCAIERATEVLGPAASKVRILPVPDGGPRFFWETLDAARAAGRADVIFAANQFTPLRPGRRVPIVTVIQDVQYAALPMYSSWKKRLWLRTIHTGTLKRARFTVTISNFSRDEMLDLYGHEYRDRIVPVYVPIDWRRVGPPVARPATRPPLLLSVGAHYPHKNFPTIAHAVRRMVDAGHDVQWVVAGQRPSLLSRQGANYPDLETLVRELDIEPNVRITGRIPDAQLNELFRTATMLVMPSLYEGFGNVPAEVLGLGMPVVATRAGAIPEVTQGLARYIDDPMDADEWAAALAEVAADPASYAPTPEAVRQIRATYDPDTIAGQYMEVFRAAVEGRRPALASPVERPVASAR